MGNFYTPGTLDDQIMRDGLSAVATLSDNPRTRESYFVVGGMATQTYLPSLCRRPTSDIDLAILNYFNREEFREYSHSIKEYLQDNSYEVTDRKFRRAFCIDFKDKDGKVAFVSIPRNNEKSYKNIEQILRREREHARAKIIEGTTETCIVASPEDIIVRKLARAVNRLARNSSFEKYVHSMENLTGENIEGKIKYLNNIRDTVFLRQDMKVKLSEESEEFLRFLSDLFDIRMLSELGGINKKYFHEALGSWNTLTGTKTASDHSEWQIGLVERAVLPDYLLENCI